MYRYHTGTNTILIPVFSKLLFFLNTVLIFELKINIFNIIKKY